MDLFFLWGAWGRLVAVPLQALHIGSGRCHQSKLIAVVPGRNL